MGQPQVVGESCERAPRPFDYIWHGQRVTYYLNHAGEWHGCPASEKYHYTLRAS